VSPAFQAVQSGVRLPLPAPKGYKMIIENLLPKTYEDEIENVLLGNNFPWYYYNVTTPATYPDCYYTNTTKDTPQFTHMFFNARMNMPGIVSEYYTLIFPIVILLEKHTGRQFSNRMIRIKANYISRESNYPENYHNIAHTDGDNVESLIYYVNNSDGNTILFNEKLGDVTNNNLTIKETIKPQKGKCLLFESDYLHASSPPKVNTNRVIINIVFEKDNNYENNQYR
jgi:hypothetical protein